MAHLSQKTGATTYLENEKRRGRPRQDKYHQKPKVRGLIYGTPCYSSSSYSYINNKIHEVITKQ